MGTAQLRDGAVATRKIQPGAITASKVARDALTGVQIREATLGTVPRATRAALATRALSAATAATADDAAMLNGQPPTAYRDACPPGFERVNSVCFEPGLRPIATWAVAARTCSLAGKRLPDASELEVAFDRMGSQQDQEWTSTLYFNPNTPAIATLLGEDAMRTLVPNADFITRSHPYRCFSNATD